MRFLVDTNLGRKFANLIKQKGHDAIFAKDLLPIFKDEDILARAALEQRVVITNDKDFGELVFRLGKASAGVILLRTKTTDPKGRFELIQSVLNKAKKAFVVVEEGRIRMRILK